GAFLDADRTLDELPGRARFDSSRQGSVAEQMESYDAGRAAAFAFIREHPGEAVSLAARKAGDLWSLTPKPRSTRSGLEGVKAVIGLLWTIPLFAFAALGLVVCLRATGPPRALAIDIAL